MRFLRCVYAHMVLQKKDYFINKSIYISLSIWPILAFLTTYFSYKPFENQKILEKLNLMDIRQLYVYLLIGFVCMMCFDTLIQSAWRSSYAIRISGALELLYMSPANRLASLIGNGLTSLFGSIWMVFIFGGITLYHYRQYVHIPVGSFIVGLMLLFFVALCWGVFLNSLFLTSRDSGFLFTIFQYPVEIFSGAKIPYRMMPLWARALGSFMPLTYVIIVLRKIVINNMPITAMVKECLISIVIGLVLLMLAEVLMRGAEKKARIKGTAVLF